MARVFRVELKVPGEYRDLWLYKGRLHLWDRVGVLRFIKFDVAIKHLAHIYGAATANLIQTFIFRNDWKVGEQFNSWMRVPEVSSAILAPFKEKSHLKIELPSSLFIESPSESYSGLVLDTNIYADRVYLATAEGLLESYINARRPEAGYELHQQTDFRASRVAVKYCAINVSAESGGLHFAPVRFWPEGSEPGFMQADWRQVADFSLASSFARRDLLNYTNSAGPSLLHSRVEEHRSERARYDDTVVVGYEPVATDLASLTYSAAISSSRVSTDRVIESAPAEQFGILGNSDYHLLANWGNRLQVIDLRADTGREVVARPSQKFRRSKMATTDMDDVLATYAISGGFVIEHYDHLDLITVDGSFTLAAGESAQVRTFESSIRHKEAIAVVQESSASVFGFYIADSEKEEFLF